MQAGDLPMKLEGCLAMMSCVLQGATATLPASHGNALAALGFWNFDFHLHGCCVTAGFGACVPCWAGCTGIFELSAMSDWRGRS